MTIYHDTFQGFLQFRHYKRTWSFPKEVERLFMDETSNGTVLHLYGGRAKFGLRLDMDPASGPDVVGNALYPPFKCKSFDYVVMDPPYADLKAGISMSIMMPAACLARKKVYWVHTHWPLRSGLQLHLARWWIGSPCSMGSPARIIVEYDVTGHPGYCVGWPRKGRKRLNSSLGIYDWTHHVPTPKRYDQPVWQMQLPMGEKGKINGRTRSAHPRAKKHSRADRGRKEIPGSRRRADEAPEGARDPAEKAGARPDARQLDRQLQRREHLDRAQAG